MAGPDALELAWVNRDPQIQMMSLHFYTFSGNDWGNKSHAVGFSEAESVRQKIVDGEIDFAEALRTRVALIILDGVYEPMLAALDR